MSNEPAEALAFAMLTTPRPIEEYHEDMGDVLWWKFPITEPPWVGSFGSLGYTVEAELVLRKDRKQHKREVRMMVGGWPGYHTHFTLIPIPTAPAPKPEAAASCGRHDGNCVCQQAGECINT